MKTAYLLPSRVRGTTARWLSFLTLLGGAIFAAAGHAVAQAPGTLDSTFNPNVTGNGSNVNPSATAVQPDGNIIIAGFFTNVGGTPRSNIARLNNDGSVDNTFDPNANGMVSSVALQADGKILIAGAFTALQPNGAGAATTRNRIARLNSDGTLDSAFDPNLDNFVSSMAVQADGKILLCGGFTMVAGTTRNYIARLNSDGSLDKAFNPNPSSAVFSVAVQEDGKVLLAGQFSTLQPNGASGATARNFVARVNSDGSLDNAFDPNADSPANNVIVQADGKILLGGTFTKLQPKSAPSATTRNYIARLNNDGSLDSGFDPNAGNVVFSVTVQADGKILLGGRFTTLQPNGAASPAVRNNIARLNNDGSLDNAFDPNANDVVFNVATQADGKTLLSGNFTALQPNGATDPTTRNKIARLNNDAASQSLSSPDSTQVQWLRGGAAPEVEQVTFELSTDGGASWGVLGAGGRIAGGWQLTGLSLPASGSLRARGRTTGGFRNGTSGLVEQTQNLGPAPTVLANISTRLRVEIGDNALIGGIIVTGNQNKKIIVRALGPSLPLADKLADPILELHDSSGALLESNDNWMDSPNKQAIIDSTIAPSDPLESAIVRSVAPGNYTAIVRGANNGTGIGVIEAYDLDTSANSKLANISTRGFVQTGDDVLIAGTIVVGQTSQKVIIRALGPSLSVVGKMADPTLELHDGNGALLEANDNWVDSPNKQAIIDTTIPPTNNMESAIVRTLPPANYTAIVRGVNNTTGIAVVEVYALN
jgi:uncharacterized delta-60 repeat protein